MNEEGTALESVEAVLLSSLLRSPDRLLPVTSIVRPEDFMWASCRMLYGAMLDCFRKHSHFDLPTLRVFCGEKIAQYGGMTWVVSVYDLDAAGVMAEDYAREVADAARRRRFLGGLEDARVEVEAGASPEEASRKVVVTSPPPREEGWDPDDLARATARQGLGITTGWKRYDDLSEVRFRKGELIVAAGRTGHCKTTFLTNLLFRWMAAAHEARERLLFYSAEEPAERIYQRVMALLLEDKDWSSTRVREAIVLGDGIEKCPENMTGAHAALRQFRDAIVVVHRPEWNVRELVRDAEERCASSAVRAIFVDYLQRIPPPPGRYFRRDLEVSTTARELKHLAVRREVPVIAGAQMARHSSDADKIPEGAYTAPAVQAALKRFRPKLWQLREGGSEQEADVALGLHSWRADYSEDAEEKNMSSVPVESRLDVGTLKDRYGRNGVWVEMKFHSRIGRVSDGEKRGGRICDDGTGKQLGYSGDHRADLEG